MSIDEDGSRIFLWGAIGSAIGLVWALVSVYALFAKNSFSETWCFLSYPIAYCIEWLWDCAVALGLYSQHNWIAFLVFLVVVSVLSGFVIGAALSVCLRHVLSRLPTANSKTPPP